MTSGIVFDIMHFSTRDGPGIRTTVFLKGCPLNCAWCHNPESQSYIPELMFRPNLCIACLACIETCQQNAISDGENGITTDAARCNMCGECTDVCYAEARALVGRTMSTAEVMDEVCKDQAFYDQSGGGVTFSGGEALLQPAFLAELLAASRARGLHTVLDTSGYASWAVIERIRPLVDLFLYDLKLVDNNAHIHWTGVSNHIILENLRKLLELGHAVTLRVPLIPGVNDGDAALHQAARLAASLPGLRGLELLPYHEGGVEKYRRTGRTYKLAGLHTSSQEQIDHAARVLRAYDLNITVGG